jgi:hypothetical protein
VAWATAGASRPWGRTVTGWRTAGRYCGSKTRVKEREKIAHHTAKPWRRDGRRRCSGEGDRTRAIEPRWRWGGSVRRGKKGLWASGSCVAEREAREDARTPRGCSSATRSAGWPAMVRRRVSLAAARAETRGRSRRRGRLRRSSRRCSCSTFIERGGRREGHGWMYWPSMDMGACGLQCHHGVGS